MASVRSTVASTGVPRTSLNARPIADFAICERVRYQAYQVAKLVISSSKVQLVAPKNNRRKFQGVLKGLRDGQVVLDTADAGTVLLALDEIERARLVPDYESELSGS